jgi:hypothetical protein
VDQIFDGLALVQTCIANKKCGQFHSLSVLLLPPALTSSVPTSRQMITHSREI